MANPFVIRQKTSKNSLLCSSRVIVAFRFEEFLGAPNKRIFTVIIFVVAAFELCALVWTQLINTHISNLAAPAYWLLHFY